MRGAAVDLVRSQIIKHNSHLAGMLFSLGLKYQRRHHARNIHFPRLLDLRRLQDPRRPRLDLRGKPNSKHCTNNTPLAEHMRPCVCEVNCFILMLRCQSLACSFLLIQKQQSRDSRHRVTFTFKGHHLHKDIARQCPCNTSPCTQISKAFSPNSS